MYSKVCKFADIAVKIEYMYPMFDEYTKGYESDDKPLFTITTTKEDLAFEQEKSGMDKLLPLPYLETLALYRKFCEEAIKENVILFHSSAIAVDGQAYLFTAPSGTGKSTHVRLWRELLGEKAVMINDDKPLLRIQDQNVIAYGTPWNGKHRLGGNVSYPVKGICLLTRGEKNEIHSISPQEAFPVLYSQTYRMSGKEKAEKTLSAVLKLSHSVPLYKLACNMQLEAAKISYQAMKGEEK